MAIENFGDSVTSDFFYTGQLPAKGCGWKSVASVAARKLDMVDAVAQLNDLRVPPGNQLEKLRGDLEGWHSIRINDQWRIIFIWTDEGPTEVQITDYH